MAWLAKLDTRAARWPRPVRWSYLSLKWYLIIGGAIGLCGLAVEEIRERRVGLGTGMVVALVFAAIKGISMAVTGPPPAPPPAR